MPIFDSILITAQLIPVAALLYFDFNEAKPRGLVDLQSEAEILLYLWKKGLGYFLPAASYIYGVLDKKYSPHFSTDQAENLHN